MSIQTNGIQGYTHYNYQKQRKAADGFFAGALKNTVKEDKKDTTEIGNGSEAQAKGTYGNAPSPLRNNQTGVGASFNVPLPTGNMLRGGGNATGLSYIIEWANDSTPENPVMVARGDYRGVPYEKRIYINDINPRNATLLEMLALEAYLDVDRGGGIHSLPVSMSGNMGLNDRADFIAALNDSIANVERNPAPWAQNMAGIHRNALQSFLDFLNRRLIDIQANEVLYSGGNGTGLTFEIRQADGFTRDNPVMVVTGRDENGDAFEKTIRLHDVNPSNATYVEMRALVAHLMPESVSSAIPSGTADKMRLNDRANFYEIFDAAAHQKVVSGELRDIRNSNFFKYSRIIGNFAISVNEEAAAEARAISERMAALGAQPIFSRSQVFSTTVHGSTHLSESQKERLRESFDIGGIKAGSPEYHRLMAELQRLGVISNSLPSNVLAATNVWENGTLRRVDVPGWNTEPDRVHDSRNVIDMFRDLLNSRESALRALNRRPDSDPEQIKFYEFMVNYKRDMIRVLEDLFGS